MGVQSRRGSRVFSEAARLDPTTPMAYWGHALVLGPEHQRVDGAGRRAEGLRAGEEGAGAEGHRPRRASAPTSTRWRPATRASPRIATRPIARSPTRCARGRRRFPTISTRARCIAESLMNLRPWNYWTRDGVPYAETARSRGVARVRAAAQSEPSGRAAPLDSPVGADRHARARRGRGRSAADADARRRPHRPHAGAHLSARRPPRRRHQGRTRWRRRPTRTTSRSAARRGCIRSPTTRTTCTSSGWARARADAASWRSSRRRSWPAVVPQEALGAVPILQGFLVVPYWAMVRFGEWDAILADPGPRHQTPFTRGRLALRARDGVRREGSAGRRRAASSRGCVELVADPALKGQTTFSTNTGYAILRIAPEVVAGEIAARRQGLGYAPCCISSARCGTRTRSSIRSRRTGTRRCGRTSAPCCSKRDAPDEAEAVFWEDLKKNPENGWSLFGLVQALEAQGKNDKPPPRARVSPRRGGRGRQADVGAHHQVREPGDSVLNDRRCRRVDAGRRQSLRRNSERRLHDHKRRDVGAKGRGMQAIRAVELEGCIPCPDRAPGVAGGEQLGIHVLRGCGVGTAHSCEILHPRPGWPDHI